MATTGRQRKELKDKSTTANDKGAKVAAAAELNEKKCSSIRNKAGSGEQH
jgi:hypothetical protein